MDLFLPTNLRSQVQIQSTPSMLFPSIVNICRCVEKRMNINKKRPWLGRRGGQGVRVLTFYYHNPSSNPTEASNFSYIIVFEKDENRQKRGREWPISKNNMIIRRQRLKMITCKSDHAGLFPCLHWPDPERSIARRRDATRGVTVDGFDAGNVTAEWRHETNVVWRFF